LYWDDLDHELYAADERGFVYIINVYAENNIVTKRVCDEKIKRVEIVEEG
jgi:hypothetical protein